VRDDRRQLTSAAFLLGCFLCILLVAVAPLLLLYSLFFLLRGGYTLRQRSIREQEQGVMSDS
jgi:hypothetical protein